MASPTTAELETQLQNAARVVHNLLSVQTIPADQDTYEQSIESDLATEQTAGVALFRSGVAGSWLTGGKAALEPVLRAYAHHAVQSPERDAAAALDRIYQFFVDNAKTVKSRGITYGAVTPGGGNVGTGTVFRLTKDENNFDIEATTVPPTGTKTLTLKCLADQSTGAIKHEEAFELRDQAAGIDVLQRRASGLLLRDPTKTSAVTSRAGSLLRNGGFEEFTLGSGGSFAGGLKTLATGDTIAGWTLPSTITNYQLDQNTGATKQYRDVEGATTPTSLRLLLDAEFSQLLSVKKVKVNASQPYLPVVPVYREASADGTITVEWGDQSQAFVGTGLTNGAWNLLVPTRDSKLWPKTWNETNPNFKVTLAGRTTGTWLFDEVGWWPMWAFDGLWYLIVGGVVKFLRDDLFTFADGLTGADAKIQLLLSLLFGRYLPHSGTPSITDPV